MTNSQEQQGFTLMELMITVAIIGIIAAIAMPMYQRYVVKAHMNAARAALSNYSSELQKTIMRDGALTAATATAAWGKVPDDNAIKSKFTMDQSCVLANGTATTCLTGTNTGAAYHLLATPVSGQTPATNSIWMDQSGVAYECKPSASVTLTSSVTSSTAGCTAM